MTKINKRDSRGQITSPTYISDIEPGEGRTLAFQSLVQLLSLVITLVASILTGLVTGLLVSFSKLFEPLAHDQGWKFLGCSHCQELCQ